MNQYSEQYRKKYAKRRELLWRIRAEFLDSLREREEVLEASPAPTDGQPRGTVTSNPTQQKAVRLTEVGRFYDAVMASLRVIPENYRDEILMAAVYGQPYPDWAAKKTFAKWMRIFLDDLIGRLST